MVFDDINKKRALFFVFVGLRVYLTIFVCIGAWFLYNKRMEEVRRLGQQHRRRLGDGDSTVALEEDCQTEFGPDNDDDDDDLKKGDVENAVIVVSANPSTSANSEPIAQISRDEEDEERPTLTVEASTTTVPSTLVQASSTTIPAA